MTVLTEEQELALPPEGVQVLVPPSDRRRPGRMNEVSPTLLPLLRDPVADSEAYDRDDDLRSSEGIAVSILLSAAPWAIIGAIIYLLVR